MNESKLPKVSMAMTCYNKKDYITDMLDSVIAQVYNNIELILVDDGSTDGTEQIIKDYVPRFVSKGIEIVVVKQHNQGLGRAVKNGLMRATGEFICITDSDDLLHTDYVSFMASYLIEHEDCEAVRCCYDGEILPSWLDHKDISAALMMQRINFFSVLFLIRRSFAERILLIEKFYAPKGCVAQEPQYVLPIVGFAKNLTLLDRELYNHLPTPGLQYEMKFRYDKLVEYCETIKNLLELSLTIYSLPDIFRLYVKIHYERVCYSTGYKTFEETEKNLLSIARESGISINPDSKDIANDLINTILGVALRLPIDFIESLHGRVIFYGVLGKNYRDKRNCFENVDVHADVMIDARAETNNIIDEQRVVSPAEYAPLPDDTIVVFPLKDEIIESVKTAYANTEQNIRVFAAKDIIKLRIIKE
jgi:glycosyltransferase involved in cell wall biosynthesis